MSEDTTELFYAYMEAHRNDAEVAYFAARPNLCNDSEQITRDTYRKVFRDGYERAYRLLWDQMVSGGIIKPRHCAGWLSDKGEVSR